MSDDDFAPMPGAKQRSGLSLKARAVGLLSRREHSRAELIKKLALHCDDAGEIERLVDELVADGWQSDERYVQSVVHRKSEIHGSARIVQDLKGQGISEQVIGEIRTQLRSSEYDRALNVWRKRFGRHGPPTNGAEYAKQGRFLAARGFSHDVIRKILKSDLDVEEVS